LKLNLFSPEFEITGRYNVREDNMVIIDLVTKQLFGFYASQNISECSFQKVGQNQKCVRNQMYTIGQCSQMELDVLTNKKACYIQNKGLKLKGIL
jgi:hypothetical protein